MMTGSDAAELRALQAKAYGQGGALTAEEASRLQELEAPRARDVAASAQAEVPSDAGEDDGLAEEPLRARTSLSEDVDILTTVRDDTGLPVESVDAETSETGGVWARLRGRAGALVVGVAAALVLVGLGVGWLAFGQGSHGIELTAAQQERRAEIEASGDFDPGSVSALGQDEDAFAWFARGIGGQTDCVILDIGEKTAQGCSRTETETDYPYASLTINEDDPDEAMQVSAAALTATDGERVAVIQRWSMDGASWLFGLEDDERRRGEELIADGYDPYVNIVGYFRDQPVWHAQRYDDNTPQECMIVDAIDSTSCIDAPNGISDDSIIGVTTSDVQESGESSTAVLELRRMPMGSVYLTITDGAAAG